MNYIQLQVTGADTAQQEVLIALLANSGFEGFEENGTTLNAFIKEAEFDKVALEAITAALNLDYTTSIIPQQNWNAQWESSFEPITVHDFVAIRAHFHQPVKGVKHEIIITPKMSFGTGHHATTWMMIAQMEALDFSNTRVVDYGTGTGVLAILAEKMGATHIDAIDYDEWSIENSIENATNNNCSRINLVQAYTITAGPVYDIILANINLNVILENLPAIQAVSKTGTYILLSGFIKTDEPQMLNALVKFGIQAVKTIQKGDWICILARMG